MSELIDQMLEILGTAGNVLDTPRAVAWEAARGGNPLDVLDPFDDAAVARRPTGWDLTKSLGIKGKEGFDPTDLVSLLTEVILDPLNAIPGYQALKAFKARPAAKASNALRAERLATGGMPEEIAKLTKARHPAGAKQLLASDEELAAVLRKHSDVDKPRKWVDEMGEFDADDLVPADEYMPRYSDEALADIARNLLKKPGPSDRRFFAKAIPELQKLQTSTGGQVKRLYHGTPEAYGEVDFSKLDPDDWVHGYFTTDSPRAASGYTEKGLSDAVNPSPNVRMQYLDMRNPFDADSPAGKELMERLSASFAENPNAVQAGTPYPVKMTEALKGMGYDSLQHMGGGGTHQVTVAFSPEQIYSPWIAPAARNVPSYMRPLLEELLYQPMARSGDR